MRGALTVLVLALVSGTLHAAITGTVVTEDGAPIAGARVSAFPAESTRELRMRMLSDKPQREPIARVTTGDDGAFRIDPKDSVAVDLLIVAPGRMTREWFAVPNQDLGSIPLGDGSPHTVHVTAGGKPVAGALVMLRRDRAARTNATGQASAGGAW